MCWIIGYFEVKEAVQVHLERLAQLEYRGYDSADVATFTTTGFQIVRRAGCVSYLANVVSDLHINGHTGIWHTRLATHGAVSEKNAHP